ncbi:FMN-linked oxidoreductase [Rhizopogon salebrosus TDB-379]|nr:FMN-linked oxidoreductase [Rhizopogon salebrosus TDB-379]
MTTPALFTPIQAGHMNLSHCIVLAPLTRCHAHDTHVPGPHAVTYYAQRASVPGSVLISEATFISQASIPRNKYKDGEKSQTLCMTRAASSLSASPEALAKENNLPLVSASPISLSVRPIHVPHALTEPEIRSYTNSFATAARNAIEVEIHAANGYLIDQSLQEVSNTREDDWGGSIEKRAKSAIEVTDAIVKEVGAEKVGVRLSPWSPFQVTSPTSMSSSQVSVATSMWMHRRRVATIPCARYGARRTRMPCSSLQAGTQQTATETAEEKGGLVEFRRLFIPNPDLTIRLMYDLPLAEPDHATFYLPGDLTGKNYIDFPAADVTQNGSGETKLEKIDSSPAGWRFPYELMTSSQSIVTTIDFER